MSVAPFLPTAEFLATAELDLPTTAPFFALAPARLIVLNLFHYDRVDDDDLSLPCHGRAAGGYDRAQSD